MAGNRESIIERVTAIAERVAASEGLEVVSVEFVGGGRNRLLRLFVDRPPGEGQTVPLDRPFGATLEDCESVSHQVGTILDVEDVIPGEGYKLEVSSPGVERKLLKLKDYERFAGHPVKVTFLTPVEGQSHCQGVLKGVQDGRIRMESGGKDIEFPLGQVLKANLKFHW